MLFIWHPAENLNLAAFINTSAYAARIWDQAPEALGIIILSLGLLQADDEEKKHGRKRDGKEGEEELI